MYLERKNGAWTVRWREHGKHRRETLRGLPDKLTPSIREKAMRRFRDRLRSRTAPDSLASFLEVYRAVAESRYRSPRNRLDVLAVFARELGVPMRDVTHAEAQAAVLRRRVKPRTARLYVSWLSAAWEEARLHGLVEANPWRGLKLPRFDETFVPPLTEGEVDRLLAAAAPAYRPLFRLIYETGLRKGEAFALVAEDVGDVLTVRRSKTRRGRVVPLTAAARAALGTVAEQRGIGRPRRVFAHLSYQAATRHLKAACVKAGLPELRVHSLRHLAALRLVRAGANPYDIKELLGHASIEQTRRYMQHDPAGAAARAIACLHRSASDTERSNSSQSTPSS